MVFPWLWVACASPIVSGTATVANKAGGMLRATLDTTAFAHISGRPNISWDGTATTWCAPTADTGTTSGRSVGGTGGAGSTAPSSIAFAAHSLKTTEKLLSARAVEFEP